MTDDKCQFCGADRKPGSPQWRSDKCYQNEIAYLKKEIAQLEEQRCLRCDMFDAYMRALGYVPKEDVEAEIAQLKAEIVQLRARIASAKRIRIERVVSESSDSICIHRRDGDTVADLRHWELIFGCVPEPGESLEFLVIEVREGGSYV